MKISRLLYSRFSSIAISFIIGLGLATIFRKECQGGKCNIFYAPSELTNKDNVYKYNNKCFKLNNIAGTCNKDKTILNFA